MIKGNYEIETFLEESLFFVCHFLTCHFIYNELGGTGHPCIFC